MDILNQTKQTATVSINHNAKNIMLSVVKRIYPDKHGEFIAHEKRFYDFGEYDIRKDSQFHDAGYYAPKINGVILKNITKCFRSVESALDYFEISESNLKTKVKK